MNNSLPTSQRVFLWVASIGPLGYCPASGTVTVAVVGIPIMYWMLDWPINIRIVVTIAVVAVSILLHDIGDRLLNEKDSRKLVWDEVAGFMVAVSLLPEFTWPLAISAFFLERFIDIIKVPPARWIENKWPGGWGVVGRDICRPGVILEKFTAAICYGKNWSRKDESKCLFNYERNWK